MSDENGYYPTYNECEAACTEANHKCEQVKVDIRVYYDCVYYSKVWLWCTISVIALIVIVGLVVFLIHKLYSVQ